MITIRPSRYNKPLFATLLLVASLLSAQDVIRSAGLGFGNLHFGQDCRLGQAYDSGNDELLFRQMGAGRSWSENEIIDSGFTPGDAALFQVRRGGSLRWEAVYLKDNNSISHAVRNSSGHWEQSSSFDVYDGYYFADALLSVDLGEEGVFHLALLSAHRAPELYYIRLDGTNWEAELVTVFSGRTEMEAFDSPHNLAPPRMLSMAVDLEGRVHLVVSADQVSNPVSGGTLVRSDLFYFHRDNESWSDRQVLVSGGSSDDAGLGASLSVAPDGTVAVASTYLPRASTGSPRRASLLYSEMQGNGDWQTETVANAADRYYSRDGEQGTGLYPVLQFDYQSRPHVLFNDHASEHALGTAFSYAGQVRYATRERADGGGWSVQTLVSQPSGDAFLRRAAPPVLATGRTHCPGRLAFYADHSDFDESSFTWSHTEFFHVEGELGSEDSWFHAASEIQPAGWRYFDWFKAFKPVGDNWIYHGHHGWLSVIGEDPSGLFLWDSALNRWLYTSESLYPWLYAFGSDGGWVWFFEDGSPGARFFARGASGAIFSEAEFGL